MQKISRCMLLLTILLICSSLSFGSQEQTVLKNEDVVKMTSAGLGNDVIIAMIRNSRTEFNTSMEAVLGLKEKGVEDEVLAVMLNASSSTSDTTSVTGREAGIYLETESGLEILEPAVFSGQRSGGFFSGLTTAIPRGRKASLRSPQAQKRLATASPVFMFYFEQAGAGLSKTGSTGYGVAGMISPGAFSGFMTGASSPNEFILVRLERKKDERQMELGRQWIFGDKTGVQMEDVVEIQFERLETGVYRVTTQEPLPAGEYAFFYAAGAGNLEGTTGKVFDFGVDPEIAAFSTGGRH